MGALMLECCPWCDMPVNMYEPEEIGMKEIKEHDPLNPLASLSLPPRIPLDVTFPGLRKFPD